MIHCVSMVKICHFLKLFSEFFTWIAWGNGQFGGSYFFRLWSHLQLHLCDFVCLCFFLSVFFFLIKRSTTSCIKFLPYSLNRTTLFCESILVTYVLLYYPWPIQYIYSDTNLLGFRHSIKLDILYNILIVLHQHRNS